MSTNTSVATSDSVVIKSQKHSFSQFPKGILSVSREELDQVELTIKRGLTDEPASLPEDLQGHLFLINPAGSIDSETMGDPLIVYPAHDGWTPLFNGDGMVYRVDFASDKALLSTKFMRTPCYYADVVTHQQEKFKHLRFKNLNFGRISVLGTRNQINTAFLPFKFSDDPQDRLLVTWDTGRPYEIDPLTLQLKTPLGLTKEWCNLLDLRIYNPVFPQVLTSAHPCVAPNPDNIEQKEEIFTVNVGKSITTFIAFSNSFGLLYRAVRNLVTFLLFLLRLTPLGRLALWLFGFIYTLPFFERLFDLWLYKENFVHLMRWKGSSQEHLDKWRIVTEDGKNIKIEQTLHQMAITQEYIVLADTSFKFNLTQIIPSFKAPFLRKMMGLLVRLIDYPELPYTNIYAIRRADLAPDKTHDIVHCGGEDIPIIKARKIEIPLPMAHYLVDYESPSGKIILHASHICATDPAVTIRDTDNSIYDDKAINNSLKKLAGTVVSPMDVSRLGCHVIDVESGDIKSSYVEDKNSTWSTAFYGYRDERPTKTYTDIYWNSWGNWSDIFSKHIYNLYKNYEKRQIPLKEVLEIAKKGIPSSICRVHIEHPSNNNPPELSLEDVYLFPEGYLGTSMQFIPKKDSQGQREGYLVCFVIKPSIPDNSTKPDENFIDTTEIWIFDASRPNLGGEPLCRLTHPRLNVGFTIHTTWLPSLSKEVKFQQDDHYSVREDYNWLIEKQPRYLKIDIKDLFENYIYPNFEA